MARERNEEFKEQLDASLNLFGVDFTEEFCFADGRIDWNKIVEFNSGVAAPPRKKVKRERIAVAVEPEPGLEGFGLIPVKKKRQSVRKK